MQAGVALSNVQPQADQEDLGTLTVEEAFDSSLVTIVNGSGVMSPNPVDEDQTVDFSVDVDNANDVGATFDLTVQDSVPETWVSASGLSIQANTTATYTLSVVPQDVPKSPGDYSMVETLTGAQEAGLAQVGESIGLTTARRRVLAASAGGGVAAAVLAGLIG